MVSKYNKWTQFYFKDLEGNPFVMTKGQEKIFRIIYDKAILRGAIKTITQYGKSEVASMALIMAMIHRREKILIVSPSIKQSNIIMGKVIDHLFEHQYLINMLDYDASKVERLKQERSKNRITMKNGSEIMILTAEASSVVKEAKSLMGFGATIVLVDESSLIPDALFGKILRMVGGVKQGKLIQLGNPFEENHFLKALTSPRYYKVSVDWRQALSEGRVTQMFLDEAKENMSDLDWMIFYECKFPRKGTDDMIIPTDWIELAINQKGCEGEKKQSSIDVARYGKDKTIYAFRKGGYVPPMQETEHMDTMEVVGWARQYIDEDEPDTTCVDIIGVGSGVYDRLNEEEYDVTAVNVGESPTTDEAKERFYNLRAEIFWHLRTMFKPDPKTGRSLISIPDDKELIEELKAIHYKYSSEKKIKIESKDEIKKTLGRSPDKADALALLFFDTSSEVEMVLY